jgi:CheY-like chemotaxis protein
MQNRTTIAAIVTDMLMPGMDGPTFVRVVRRIDPQIRIIGITGMGDSTPAATAESLAMSALLSKTLHRRQPPVCAACRAASPAGHQGGAC